jgi:tRNA threonylcarbamoyladenosine biosynthesis protein TsaB
VLEDLPATGETRVHLSEVAPDLAPALLRLFHHQPLPSASGTDIHTVVPDYALPVEAEVRLAEKEREGQ